MMQPIPTDATIADVLPTLRDADDYVRILFGKMTALQRQHGAVVVRIGVTGKGIMPNYRIEHAGEPPRPITAFDGQTHNPFTDTRNIETENWSTRIMTYAEVRDLLGQMRGFKR